jgi:MFS family permease
LKQRSLLLAAAAAGINNLIIPGPLLAVYILSLGAEVENIGTVISLLIISGTVASFFGSTLGDIYGRRNILITALCFDLAGSLVLMITTTWVQTLPAVVLKGVGAGLLNPVLNALVAVLSTTEERGRAFGTVQTIRRGSFMLGPAIGGVLAYQYGYAAMWLGVALSTLVSLLCFLFVRGEVPEERSAILNPREIITESYKKIATTFQHPVARLLLLTAFGSTFAFSLAEPYVSVHAKNIGANPAQIGFIGTAVGATFFLNYIGGKASDSISSFRRKILIVSALVAFRFVTLIGIPFINSIYILIGVWFTVYAYDALAFAPWNAVASQAVDRSAMATYFGAAFTISALGMSIGPQLGGILWSLGSEVLLYGVAMTIGLIALIPYVLFVPPLMTGEQ